MMPLCLQGCDIRGELTSDAFVTADVSTCRPFCKLSFDSVTSQVISILGGANGIRSLLMRNNRVSGTMHSESFEVCLMCLAC